VVIFQHDPALEDAWYALAEAYTAQTGIAVTILNSGSADCVQALSLALEQEVAPTIFCLHHQDDLDVLQGYCLNLQSDRLLEQLCRDDFTLSTEDGVWGIANNVESYGLIYNASLLARTGYTGSDITSYESLANIAQFITKNAQSLGVSAFTSPDLIGTHHGSLLCLLSGLQASDSDLRSFWDLYIANDIVGTDSIKDFLDQKAVFYLGGTWDYNALSPLTEIVENNLQMLPVYTSSDSENLGLYHSCTGYWSVNSQARQVDIDASLDFLRWLVTAQEGGAAPVDTLGLMSPYKGAVYTANPLEEVVRAYLREDLQSINWNSCDTLTPDQLSALGTALSAYTANPSDKTWAAVEKI
jgi:raffinose/stachyose/melibiose transport system substrate-binding protein